MADSRPVLIVALGNPGPEYANTRHNVGFLTADALLRRVRGITDESGFVHGRMRAFRLAGRTRWVLYPNTYMNRSGWAVREALGRLRCRPEEVLVVCDCMDLPTGKVRLRPSGGAGGHHGLESVMEVLGGGGFPRLRIGIGRPPPGAPGTDHVLGEWSSEERRIIEQAVETAAEAVMTAMVRGVEAAMNRFNGLPPPNAAPDGAAGQSNATGSTEI